MSEERENPMYGSRAYEPKQPGFSPHYYAAKFEPTHQRESFGLKDIYDCDEEHAEPAEAVWLVIIFNEGVYPSAVSMIRYWCMSHYHMLSPEWSEKYGSDRQKRINPNR